MNEPETRVIVRNRRARHDFHVLSAVEAGIEVENIAESGLIDFEQLQSFRQL